AQIAGADRLAGGEISLDDALEDLTRALVKLTQAHGGFGRNPGFVDVGMAHSGANLGAPSRPVKLALLVDLGKLGRDGRRELVGGAEMGKVARLDRLDRHDDEHVRRAELV